jgi:Ca2+-binding EF-hand superfamily protein
MARKAVARTWLALPCVAATTHRRRLEDSMTIGSATTAGPNPALLALLSQLTGTQGTSDDESSDFTPSTGAASSSSSASAPNNTLTGSGSASISNEILHLLVQMQQQAGAGTASSSTSASTSTMINPLQQLFSSLDTDGDGEISQSEMEGAIEKLGGTQNQADALYAQLDQNGSSGISEQQLASATMPQRGGGGHHHHHHIGGAGGQMADSLMQALDSNDDGSVSQDEFTSFVTANGGTSADATSDFSALDPSGSGSLTTASLTQAWENLQSTQSAASGSAMVSLLDAFAKANTVAATSSLTA